jgi:hypothetical protein
MFGTHASGHPALRLGIGYRDHPGTIGSVGVRTCLAPGVISFGLIRLLGVA